MSKRVAVLIKDKARQYQALRSSLGLLLEKHVVSIFVLDHEVEMTEEYRDGMGFVDEMGGARYSNVPANVERHGFQAVTLEALAARLKESDLVIPL